MVLKNLLTSMYQNCWGKSIINLKTYNRIKGRSDSYTTKYQIKVGKLVAPDEVRLIDNEYAIFFIRAVGVILLSVGIVQIGLILKSHNHLNEEMA